jgi:hypothetical protein
MHFDNAHVFSIIIAIFNSVVKIMGPPPQKRQRRSRRHHRDASLMPHFFMLQHGQMRSLNENSVPLWYCGRMNNICLNCNATFWTAEATTAGLYNKCCSKLEAGLLVYTLLLLMHPKCVIGFLPMLPPPPNQLLSLYGRSHCKDDIHADSRYFFTNVRVFNSVLAMTSMGCDRKTFGSGVPVFKISGVLHHRIGSLLPQNQEKPKFSQLYLCDKDEAVNNRLLCGLRTERDKTILRQLLLFLERQNPYILKYKQAVARVGFNEHVKLVFKAKVINPKAHKKAYSLPSANQVAAIIPDDNEGMVCFLFLLSCVFFFYIQYSGRL